MTTAEALALKIIQRVRRHGPRDPQEITAHEWLAMRGVGPAVYGAIRRLLEQEHTPASDIPDTCPICGETNIDLDPDTGETTKTRCRMQKAAAKPKKKEYYPNKSFTEDDWHRIDFAQGIEDQETILFVHTTDNDDGETCIGLYVEQCRSIRDYLTGWIEWYDERLAGK